MNHNRSTDISNFYVAGINYKKTDVTTRGRFTINNDQYENILRLAPSCNLDELFILSTCNRTEIYGLADNAAQLINLLCTQTRGNAAAFTEIAYIKKGNEAVQHLFNVGGGLDSQILGDYEIVGQLKQAVKFSKERNFISCFSERMVNSVLQSSKMIKNETALSDGTVSVSFAAVQYIKRYITDIRNKKILLVGTGKIGRNTCKNLVDYLRTTHITLINRSEEKAAQLAAELNLKYAPIKDLPDYIASSDIILVATNSDKPTILRSQLENTSQKLIIDLSVPFNVEAAAQLLSNIKLVNVDELSKLKDETMQRRESETPKAKWIIAQHQHEFLEWCRMRKNASTLKSIKAMLNKIAVIHQRELNNPQTRCPYIAAEQKIQQTVNKIASKMREQNQFGCYHIEAINEFIKPVNH
jgi:glutamyl-tRNA reductase